MYECQDGHLVLRPDANLPISYLQFRTTLHIELFSEQLGIVKPSRTLAMVGLRYILLVTSANHVICRRLMTNLSSLGIALPSSHVVRIAALRSYLLYRTVSFTSLLSCHLSFFFFWRISQKGSTFSYPNYLHLAFIRRLDIINRGFSGYNTSQALIAFPKFMPKPEQATVQFITIFFGANDACLPSSPTGQHVPLEEYAANLRKIIKLVREFVPGARIILISPPPVNEYQLEKSDLAKYGTMEPRRTAEHTKRYAEICRDVQAERKSFL